MDIFAVALPRHQVALRPLFPDRIGIYKCWFLWREQNWRNLRETLGVSLRANNKLNPHMMPGPGIESRPHWWEVSTLSTAPPLLTTH